MEHEKIFKLVEECAEMLSADKIEGIKNLEARFKSDPITLKGILTLMVLRFPEHADFLTSYLMVGLFLSGQKEELVLEEHLNHYPSIRELVISKLDIINLQLHAQKYSDSETSIRDIIKELEDFLHDISVGITIKPSASLRQGKTFDEISAFQKKLNRLSDFVVVGNQDKILKEMAGIQLQMKNLETSIQEHIVNDF